MTTRDEDDNRDRGCDLCLGEGTMSRKNFEIEMVKNKLYVSFSDKHINSEALFKIEFCPLCGRKLGE